MPLGTPGYYGTDADGTENKDWCKFCYQNGAFMEPDLTMQGMIDRSVHFMAANLQFSEQEARQMSESVIPTLKRWR